MDYCVMNTEMTYLSDQDDLYYPYLDFGIDSLLMTADILNYSFK